MLKYELSDQISCHDFILLENFFFFFKELGHISKPVHNLLACRLHNSLVGPP